MAFSPGMLDAAIGPHTQSEPVFLFLISIKI